MENVRRLSPIGILPVYLLKLGVWGRLARPMLTLHWWIIFSNLLSNVYSPNIVSNGSLVVVVVVVVLLWYLHLFLSQLEYKDCCSHTAAKWPPDVNKQINCCLSSVSSSLAKMPEVKWKKFVQIVSDFIYRSASVSLLHATQHSESCGLQIGCIEQLCCNNTQSALWQAASLVSTCYTVVHSGNLWVFNVFKCNVRWVFSLFQASLVPVIRSLISFSQPETNI